MKYLYVNGLLIHTKRFIRLDFVKVDDNRGLEIDMPHRILTIKFLEGDLSDTVSYIDIDIIDPAIELQEESYKLRDNTILNGLEYIVSGNTEIVNIQQFLVDEKILLADGIVVENNTLSILLQNTSTKKNDVAEYIDFINSSGYLYVPAQPSDWVFANFYFCPIDGNNFNSNDTSVLADQKPFDLDSATNIDALITAIQKKYPELSLFTSEFKRDTSKDEYLRYEFNLDDLRDTHTTIYHNNSLGKYWYTVINGEFEYSTTDYLKCLARRSSYLSNEFLVSITNSKFIFNEQEYSNAIFWERNDITTDPKLNATDSSTDYKLFGFKVRAKIYCPLAQYENRHFPTILYPLVEVINKKFTDK